MAYYGRWKPYVPVAKRRAQAKKKMASLRKTGVDIQPITIEGRKMARTFWGEAWCEHLESFSDYDNRLPRGRTYVRNGSVCHLAVRKGEIEAKVSGSEIYDIRVKITTLSAKKWADIKKKCSGQIGSLLELLAGRLSSNIMSVVADRKRGLFPKPAEINFNCDCPDWADMCKHVAAVLYGVGARLDDDPSLLFLLRGVDHEELVDQQIVVPVGSGKSNSKRLTTDDLGDVFGIELASDEEGPVESVGQVNKKKRTRGQSIKKKKKSSPKAATKTAKKSARKKTGETSVKKKATRKEAAAESETSNTSKTAKTSQLKKGKSKRTTSPKKRPSTRAAATNPVR